MDKQVEQERFISHHIIDTPFAMYDIGVGPKSEYKTLKDIYPSMSLFGCEPLLSEYTDLKEKFDGPILEKAIGPTGSYREIHYDQDDFIRASFMQKRSMKKLVQVISLDAFDKWAGEKDRILLWADIEGSELPMLYSGMKLLGTGRVRWINLEESFDKPKEIRETRTLLDSFDYERVFEYNKHETHQDVIYVHKDEPRR